MHYLLKVHAIDGVKEYIIDEPVTTIGRYADNAIVLDGPQISRHHARLELIDDQLYIVDLGSSNGTTVNGKEIKSQIPDLLYEGDRISIVDYTLSVHTSDITASPDTSIKDDLPVLENNVPQYQQAYNTVGTAVSEKAHVPLIKRLSISLRMIIIGIVALLLSAVIGAAIGFFTAELSYPSPDQQVILNELGQPPVWFLSDGPVKPGDDIHRMEFWFYPDSDVWLSFIDGYSLDRVEGELNARSGEVVPDIDPCSLNRTMTRDDVEVILGENSMYLSEFECDVFENTEAYYFPDSSMLVIFLDDTFYYAETY
jgi:hypothetical protein